MLLLVGLGRRTLISMAEVLAQTWLMSLAVLVTHVGEFTWWERKADAVAPTWAGSTSLSLCLSSGEVFFLREILITILPAAGRDSDVPQSHLVPSINPSRS